MFFLSKINVLILFGWSVDFWVVIMLFVVENICLLGIDVFWIYNIVFVSLVNRENFFLFWDYYRRRLEFIGK